MENQSLIKLTLDVQMSMGERTIKECEAVLRKMEDLVMEINERGFDLTRELISFEFKMGTP